MMLDRCFRTSFRAAFDYPVLFTRHALESDSAVLAAALNLTQPEQRLLVCIDAGLVSARPDLCVKFQEFSARHGLHLVESPVVVPGGEAGKDGLTHVLPLLERMERHALCRQSVLLAIGGGAMLDAAGLAAALFHRGVRLVRMPSTTLSQADSGVGVKNGVNWRGQKNLLGCFAPPQAVVCDLDLPRSLPRDHVLDGIAEAIKVAVIRDTEFFQSLVDMAERLAAHDWDAIDAAVMRSAMLHARHIAEAGDPFEQGSARPLDFGHWAAHRLEVLSGHTLRHGRAVAIGLALDTAYAAEAGLLPREEERTILELLECVLGPPRHPVLQRLAASRWNDLLAGIEQFRAHLGGRLAITLPTALGQALEVDHLDPALLRRCLDRFIDLD